jgi:hypothetical protein
MENAIWRRSMRRGQKPLSHWWLYLTRYSTYKNKVASFLHVNENSKNPVFSKKTLRSSLPWFEETLPLLRRFA